MAAPHELFYLTGLGRYLLRSAASDGSPGIRESPLSSNSGQSATNPGRFWILGLHTLGAQSVLERTPWAPSSTQFLISTGLVDELNTTMAPWVLRKPETNCQTISEG